MKEPDHRLTDRKAGGSGLGPVGIAILAMTAGVAAGYAIKSLREVPNKGPLLSDAPPRAVRGRASGFRESHVTGRAVTINRPRSELYAYWRDLSHLPRFMENLRAIEVLDDKRSRWRIAAPGGMDIEFQSEITEDQTDELIAWRSVSGAEVRNSGRVRFHDAPGGRGTIVDATLAYDPPGGAVGRLVAKVFQREPAIQIRRDLKRFKQLMETGEIATTEPGPAAPRA
jgi:uncharacterized membrane protein